MSTNALTDLGGSSRQSLATARNHLDGALKGASTSDANRLAEDLFAVVAALDSSTALRRALTDMSRDAGDKSALVRELFAAKVAEKTSALISDIATLRWSSPSDLADALEQLAIEASASAANIAGELDRLEDELFTFSKIVSNNPDLRQALSDSKFTGESKQSLVHDMMEGKVAGSTANLLRHLVAKQRGRNIEGSIAFYSAATAARRNRVIALVRSAIELTSSQKEALEKTLTAKIGQPVRLNLEIDRTVLGGISIRFADELIDATIVSRLADAGRSLAG
ncbi:MAG: F0F1 ATP synthase subunit delta [Actinobacteria bacterium]|nr:F0F1 ATP synthase subunit delta [Actinomycetota bacterium]